MVKLICCTWMVQLRTGKFKCIHKLFFLVMDKWWNNFTVVFLLLLFCCCLFTSIDLLIVQVSTVSTSYTCYGTKSKTILNYFSVWFLGESKSFIDGKHNKYYLPLPQNPQYSKSRAVLQKLTRNSVLLRLGIFLTDWKRG